MVGLSISNNNRADLYYSGFKIKAVFIIYAKSDGLFIQIRNRLSITRHTQIEPYIFGSIQCAVNVVYGTQH